MMAPVCGSRQRRAWRQGGEQDNAQHGQEGQSGPAQPAGFEGRIDFVGSRGLFGIARLRRVILAQARLNDTRDDKADDHRQQEGRGGLEEVIGRDGDRRAAGQRDGLRW